MISTTIPIQGTFDIAKGRNSLRAHVAAQRWPPTFGARATATLTALGELILRSNRNNVVIVRMSVVNSGDDPGVQFSCSIQIIGNDGSQLMEAEQRLERAADFLDIQKAAQTLQITAMVRLQ